MDLETLYHGYFIALSSNPVTKVDRDNGIIQGYVVAQEGAFKSEGRGRFDLKSLEEIVRLGNSRPKGLKSRFTHPDASNDGLGKFLGRSTGFALSETQDKRTCVRGNLKFDKSAYQTPSGDLASYVMGLCESDSDALSTSLVLKAKKISELNSDGSKNNTPPLWIPTELHASDIVDTGDAVDGMLSIDNLPNSYLYKACSILDLLFPENISRKEIEERLGQFTKKYLDTRYGLKPDFSMYRKQLKERVS